MSPLFAPPKETGRWGENTAPAPSGVNLGDQQDGWTASFTRSSGQRDNLLGYTARHGNVIYGVMGQGEMRSVPTPPETAIRQFMRQMKSNLDGAVR